MQYVVTYTKLFTTIDLNKTGIPETIIKIANIKLIFSIDKNKNNNQLSFSLILHQLSYLSEKSLESYQIA